MLFKMRYSRLIRKLDQYDDSLPLAPRLFRIAHNRCIDFLRRRSVRVEAETTAMSPDFIMPVNAPVLGVGRIADVFHHICGDPGAVRF
jgi:RNA polymerase sigma-70 factor (ECF subfamily)